MPIANRAALACCWTILFFTAEAYGQAVNRRFNFDFGVLYQDNEPEKYELRATSSTVGSGFIKLISPTGVEYDEFNPKQTFNTFAEMLSGVVGEWQVRENYNTSTFPSIPKEDTYKFTLNSFSLDNVWHEKPTVLTPADGSVVPRVYDVIWDVPSGIVPTGRGWQAVGFPAITTEYGVAGNNSFRVTATTKPGEPRSLTMAVRASNGAFKAPIDFTQPTGVRPGTFQFASGVISWSPSFTVTVVPEPESLTLASLAYIPLATVARRKFADAERGR